MKYLHLFFYLAYQLCVAQNPSLLIAPEKSEFAKTSTYQEVMEFLTSIQQQSGNMHLISMGKSLEGKEIPVVVLANPKVETPEQAKASGKPIVYIQGNIHAGEVEGKEAVMILMRDILLGNKKYLLDKQIILFAPIYNTDSNDKMEKGRRPSQEDSPPEVGIRENSQGLDLNRDGVKMEALETIGLFENIIVPWDPMLFVDLHTTNGTWHAWNLTWAPSYHYAGERATSDFTFETMLPAITLSAKRNYDLNFGPYGDYDVEKEGWPIKNFFTYNHHPRYLVNQFSLRNRMAILSEAFSHERFYQRIFSTQSFVAEILQYVYDHHAEMQMINKQSEEASIKLVKEQAGKVKKGVRFNMMPLKQLDDFITYDYVSSIGADGIKTYVRSSKIIKLDSVLYHAKFVATVESTLPRGYVIPAAFGSVIENLKKHGVIVTRLTKSQKFSGEIFQIEKLESAQRKFEGHFMARAFGKFIPSKRSFQKGDYLIDLAQPLGNLAFYFLEPESDDGYVTWNFFDDYLKTLGVGEKLVEYPVFKYY
jgi:Zinc carboxypeptidase